MKLRQVARSRAGRILFALFGWLLFAPGLQMAQADDFRVASKVVAGQDDTRKNEALSIFHDGQVYNFMTSPHEITIYNLPQSKIELLDPARQVRAEITIDQLATFVEKLRVLAARQTDPLLRFAAEPKFQATSGDKGWRTFESQLITYRVRTTMADDQKIAHAYREFADISARLNALVNPGSMPPMPRLAVNAALDQDGQIPEEVEVTLRLAKDPAEKPTILHSNHLFKTGLAPSDSKLLDDAKQGLSSYKEIALDEYLKPQKPETKPEKK
ncbi:MAG TPA: hypothetical protein VGJ15_08765 [Pirellulales bacterium]